MRAKLTDKQVCADCNGTGTRIIETRNYSYSVPCTRPLPTEQPELIAEESKAEQSEDLETVGSATER